MGAATVQHLKKKMVIGPDGKLIVQEAPIADILAASRENALALANESREIVLADGAGGNGKVCFSLLSII